MSKLDKILIYGFAREGKSALRFLKVKFKQSQIDIYDEGIEKYSKKPNFSQYRLIVVSAGISRDKLPKSVLAHCTSVIELFFDSINEAQRKKIIGVTGTKGKSTTSLLLGRVLEAAGYKVKVAGNIGVPALALAREFTKGELDFLVLELSSFQLEHLTKSPGVGIFLNLYQDHLDRHKTMSAYRKAKASIWEYQKQGDVIVVPKSQVHSVKLPASLTQKVVYTSPLPENWTKMNPLFSSLAWRDDFGTAWAVVKSLGVSEQVFKRVLKKFQGLPHREEAFGKFRGVEFVDDSIAVNPAASMAAVENFRGKLGCIVLGGADRRQDFHKLLTLLMGLKVWIVVLDTPAGKKIQRILRTAKYSSWTLAGSMKVAVGSLLEHAKRGQVCLLSPAAPSFGWYRNFEERGKDFKKEVQKQIKQK